MHYLIRVTAGSAAGDIAEVRLPDTDEERTADGTLTAVWAVVSGEGAARRFPVAAFTRLARTKGEQDANPGSVLL